MDYTKKFDKKHIAIIVAAILVIVVFVVIMIFVLSGNDGDGDIKGTGTTTVADPESSEITEATASDTDETVTFDPSDTIEGTMGEDTETVEPPKTDEPPVTTDEPIINDVVVPATEYVAPEDRDIDFSGCLFIGDSRTEGLMLYSGVSGATAYTARGLMVDTYFKSPVVNMNGESVTVAEAVEASDSFDRVYIMLGVNELGWPYESVFASYYGKVIDHLKEHLPDAEINVQSIIPVTASRSTSDEVYNNNKINLFNKVIREMCDEKEVNYVDLIPGICGGYNALPDEAAFDGIHLKMPYCKRWLDCLKNEMKYHTVVYD